jgi:hypothetical protein
MSDPVPPVSPGPILPGGLDCSPDAQDQRRIWLAALQASFYSGVQQVNDRNRSVTYKTPQQMQDQIGALIRQIEACTAGAWPTRRSRVYFVPQVKDL